MLTIVSVFIFYTPGEIKMSGEGRGLEAVSDLFTSLVHLKLFRWLLIPLGPTDTNALIVL